VSVGRCLAIALAVCTAVGLTAAPAISASADAAYTVANYPVEATAANAVAAKEQALADGQQAALRSLLKRLVPVTAYKRLANVADLKAGDLVSGVSVRSERNSATEYIASLDFSFQPDGIRSALSRQGIPFVDQQAPTVTVLPVVQQGSPGNDSALWRRAWTGLDLKHTITPVNVKELKPSVRPDTVAAMLAGDDKGLQALTSDYGTGLVVMAVAEPDLAANRLTVTLAGRDAVGPLLLKRTYRISDGDLDYASQLAAVVALGVLEGRWKAIKTAAPPAAAANADMPVWAASTSGNGEDVSMVVEFSSAGQWNDMRGQLLDTPGVDALNIEAVTEGRADVSLQYPGGARALANALGSRGLSLTATGGTWILRPSY